MLSRQIPQSRSFTLFRMTRCWVDPLLAARGQPLVRGQPRAIFMPRLIHATFYCIARNRSQLASWQCMPWEPHGYCFNRHPFVKYQPTHPSCSPRWPYGPGPRPAGRPPRASPPPGHSREESVLDLIGDGNPLSLIVRSRVPSSLKSSSPRRRGPSDFYERHWIPAVACPRML